MTQDFPRLVRSSASHDVATLIKEMILSGRLKPGERLPSERELGVQLGISRPTLRESIRSLVALKILEVRQGDGTYVGSLKAETLVEPLRFALLLGQGALQELFEARLVLEPALAALAAKRISDGEIIELNECLTAAYEVRDDPDEFARYDVELHQLIARASRNRFLARQVEGLHAIGLESRALTVRLPHVADVALASHSLIVGAISTRDPVSAENEMRRHIEAVADAAASVAPPSDVTQT